MSCRDPLTVPSIVFLKILLAATVFLSIGACCDAQEETGQATAPESQSPERSIEDLNLSGAAVTMPPFSDTMFGVDADFRRAMYGKGMLFRLNMVPRYTQNLLDGPVPGSQQVYIGQRPTAILGANPVFAADLRQLHLHQAQLNVGFSWRYTNWEPAGPDTVALMTLYFFKRWGDRRVEIKTGYLGNDQEFVGLQVGGSTSTGAQGVYAVLPNEVGLSHFPLTAPSLNLRLRGTTHTYVKTAAQRSLDAAGGQATIDRNPTGFRFHPQGTGVLLIGEGGYQRASSQGAPQAWLRAGYMRNSTAYTNRITGQAESGNYCAYVLMDYQVRKPAPAAPARGLYLGATGMAVASELSAYDRYYEARVYQRGTFPSRPSDVVAFIASYRGHSQYFTDPLIAQGKTVWRTSTSFTGTYTLHAARGNYLSLSLGYVRGPALSPRVDDALTFTVNWGLYL
jgi:porin